MILSGFLKKFSNYISNKSTDFFSSKRFKKKLLTKFHSYFETAFLNTSKKELTQSDKEKHSPEYSGLCPIAVNLRILKLEYIKGKGLARSEGIRLE